ncbi:polysaccharide deacetylase family protein [Chloroflexota bacterium]
MTDNKPIASLSLDLDNQWSYMKTHGDPGWETFPSYFDIVVPRILKFLDERNLTITFFIVGQDAALEKNHPAIKAIADAGHEIGNHSFNHEPWLHIYTEQQIEAELNQAEEVLEQVTGQHPIGFRGPGYSLSETVIRVLMRRGYLYDCSTLPTYLGPLARAYYFMTTKLSPQEKEQRDLLFGTLRDGLRSIRPYKWQLDDAEGSNGLVEIPVTTMPVVKIPIHASYVLFISSYSPRLALLYFRFALWLCRLTGVQPSLLLHPLDFLGPDDITDLSFFPGMNLNSEKKLIILGKILDVFSDKFQVVTIHKHTLALIASNNLSKVLPSSSFVNVS